MSTKTSRRILVGTRVCPSEKGHSPLWRVNDGSNCIQFIGSQEESSVFDYAFDERATNQEVFDHMGKKIVQAFVRGMNGTILAFGQIGSGKTYTMEGDSRNPGVMPLAAKEIFRQILEQADRKILLRVGCFEIFNEKAFDLLDKKKPLVKIDESSSGQVTIVCKESIVVSENELLQVMKTGRKQRRLDGGACRSHRFFRIIMESRKCEGSKDGAVRRSILNLVDLAGHEGVQVSAAKKRSLEGTHANKSLHTLSDVMIKLAELQKNEDPSGVPISFGESKLTSVLQESLCGNAVTSIIGTIKPSAKDETRFTIDFGVKAMTLSTSPTFNDVPYNNTFLKRIEGEIEGVEAELIQERRKKDNQLKISELERSVEQQSSKIISTNSLIEKHQQKRRRSSWPVPNHESFREDTRLPVLTKTVPSHESLREDTRLPLLTKPPQVQKPKPTPSRIPSRSKSLFVSARNTLAPSATKDAVQEPSKVEGRKPKTELKDSTNDALLAEINALVETNEKSNLRIRGLEDQVKTLQQTINMLKMDHSKALKVRDITIEGLLALNGISHDVLRDSKVEELRSVCPDLQSSCESICNNCQELGRLLPPADDKDMEAIHCVCDKLRAEIAATRSQLESVQSAFDQCNGEVPKMPDHCQQFEELRGQYDSLENHCLIQQEGIKTMQEEYEQMGTTYEQILTPELEAENPQILEEIATLKQRVEQTKLKLNQSSSFVSLTKAENANLKDELAELHKAHDKLNREHDCLSTQAMDSFYENERLQKLLNENSSCDLKLEAEIAKEHDLRREFFKLADTILQIELHTDSELCYLFTSTKLKGSRNTGLIRVKLYLDSAKFMEDQSCVQDSTSATVLNGLIKQLKFQLVTLTNREFEEETKEKLRLTNAVSKLEKKLLIKDELLVEKSTNLNDLRKQLRTMSNKAVESNQKMRSQTSQMLEKDKVIEKLKAEIEELCHTEQLEKLNLRDRASKAEKSLAELQRSFDVLQSKDDQSRASSNNEKLLCELQEELGRMKVELSTKTEEVEALTAAYKSQEEIEGDALRNKICELEEENKNIVALHQEEMEDFKKLLLEKLNEAQADYLHAVEVRNKLKEAEREREEQLARFVEMNSSLEDMMSQRDSEKARALELEKSRDSETEQVMKLKMSNCDLEIAIEHLKMEIHQSERKSLMVVKDAEDRLEELQRKFEKQTRDMEQLMKENVALQSRIEEAEAEHLESRSKLEAEYKDLAAKKITLQERADTFEAKARDLRQELLKAEETTKDYDELRSTQEELISSLSDAKNSCTELKAQIEHLEYQLNVAHEEALQQNSEKEKLRKDLDLALEEKESAIAKKGDLEMQLADLNTRLSIEALKHEKQVSNLNGSITELQLKGRSLHEQNEEQVAVIEEMKLKLKDFKNLQVQLREEQEARAELKELYSNLQSVADVHAKSKLVLSLEIERGKQHLLKVTEERDKLQAELESKLNCGLQEQEELVKLKNSNANLEKRLSVLKARDKMHRQSFAQATKESEQLRNEIKKFQQDKTHKDLLLSNLLKEKGDVEDKLKILKASNESKVDLVAQLRAKEFSAEVHQNKLEMNLDDANKRYEEIMDMMDPVVSERDFLKSIVENQESEFLKERERLDATISSLLADKSNMGDKICTLTEKVEKLKKDLAAAPSTTSQAPPAYSPLSHGLDRNFFLNRVRNSHSEMRRNRRRMAYDNNRLPWLSNLTDSETDTADMNGNGNVVTDAFKLKYLETLRMCDSQALEINSLKEKIESQKNQMAHLQQEYEVFLRK